MIERRHREDATESLALYSECEGYRYRLTRTWNGEGGHVLFVMLNPSTATERRNDPTVGRCEGRARAAGFGVLTVCNLFGWRATRPADLRTVTDPVGPDNDGCLLEAARAADRVICAWGIHGALAGRGAAVAALLRGAGCTLFHFGLTRDGHPRHPLYLARTVAAARWDTVRPETA